MKPQTIIDFLEESTILYQFVVDLRLLQAAFLWVLLESQTQDQGNWRSL